MSNPDPLDDLKRLYAAAPADGPPAALDAAILAHARREAGSATPIAGTGPRAWGPPLAMAAMLVLTVSLVLLMEREQPEVASVAGIAPPARDLALAPTAKQEAKAGAANAEPRAAARERVTPDRKPAAERSARAGSGPAAQPFPSLDAPAAAPERRDAARAVANAAPPAAAPETLSEAAPPRSMGRASPAAPALAEQRAMSRDKALVDEAPETWLKRLAELKQQGRQKEFEDGLAEFRKRHPAYPVPEALLSKK